MKKLILMLVMPLASLSLYAQEISKQKEVGLTFANLNNFGVTFRTGNSKALWRFNSLLAGGYNDKQTADSTERETKNSRFQFSIGREFRKPITDNFTFRFGMDVSFSYSKYVNKTDDKTVTNHDYSAEEYSYGPGVNLVLGLNYKLGKSFIVGAELLPYIHYQTGKREQDDYYAKLKSDTSNVNYSLSNSTALLSFVYVF